MEAEFRYKVRNMEPFKDGNVLGGRFLRAGEILLMTENEKMRVEQSGGTLDVIEIVVPNPKKFSPVELTPETEVNVLLSEINPVEESVEAPQPAKRKAGRPRKNG